MEYELTFKKFPIIFDPITIKQGFILYRYSKTSDPINTTEPRFFSDYDTATYYDRSFGTGSKQIYACKMKQLFLIDIRLAKSFILELGIQAEEDGSMNRNDALREYYNLFMKAFGFMSLQKQLENTSQQNLPSPIENYGLRSSETSRDDKVVSFMKELFGDYFDGYIAPEMKAVKNINEHGYLHSEICLFNPSKCIEKTSLERNESNKIIDLNTLLFSNNTLSGGKK